MDIHFFTCQHENSNNFKIIYLNSFQSDFLHVLLHLIIFQTPKQGRQNAVTFYSQVKELRLKDVQGFGQEHTIVLVETRNRPGLLVVRRHITLHVTVDKHFKHTENKYNKYPVIRLPRFNKCQPSIYLLRSFLCLGICN